MTRLSVDDHTQAMTRKEVQLPGSSMRNFKQNDDDCVSENSFPSDFGDNAADKEDLKATKSWDANIEPESPPPVYSEVEHPQADMFLLANKDVRSPSVVLQYTPPTGSTDLQPESPFSVDLSGRPMCVVCKVSPAYSRDGVCYPTCRSLTCASKMRRVPVASLNFLPRYPIPPPRTDIGPSSASPLPLRSQMKMCDVCHVRPPIQKVGKTYPTCGTTCAAALKNTGPSSNGNVSTLDPPIKTYQSSHFQQPSQAYRQGGFHQHFLSLLGGTTVHTASTAQPCVVCLVNPCCDGRFVTCGMKCTETLCGRGSSDPEMCDYCHRRPKFASYDQCGKTCRDNARKACLLCRRRPKVGRYPLCGELCKLIATKWTHATPLILEARPGHTIYNEVEQYFKRAWKANGVCPPIKKIYKIIENKSFLLSYDRYKNEVGGNEVFRYHGTSRRCMLGSQGNTRLCSSATCALCSVLQTSFKASQSGPFGAGVYTSSTANQAYCYSNGGKGAIIVTKVVLGTVYDAQTRHQVDSCPPGYNSVVFDRKTEKLDDITVVYTDDAIRPVFLITF